jgi:glycosyltransferase involved in cell wall biosynthesis
MAFFSVIIPLYNKENFIEKTMQSILNQTFQDFEIIVVNDGSTDRSEEKLIQFQDSRIQYYHKENAGVSSARNLGIEKASANYITFIDADDYWYPDFLKVMYENITNLSDYKVFSAAIEVDTSKKVIPSQYSIIKTGDYEIVNYFKASLKESVIFTSCAVFDRSIFTEIGNFDTNIKSGQDTDLWVRIGLKYPVLFTWKVLARYVYDENSLSKNTNFIASKMDFTKFLEYEKSNSDLKKFLDLNRFSLAIKSKIAKEDILFKKHCEDINLQNLNLRKRILLKLPASELVKLINLKTKLAHLGVGSSVFK